MKDAPRPITFLIDEMGHWEFPKRENFESYLERLKERRTEDYYRYTDKDLENNISYIKDCWETNLSVYKCLEWMSFYENTKQKLDEYITKELKQN
jgi:hypothetical protein